jgi:hypothetical protein
MALMFRNESEAVVRKAHQKKESKKDGGRTASQTRNSADHAPSDDEESSASSTDLVTSHPKLLGSSAHLLRNLTPSVQDLATCFFFRNFVLSDSDNCKGHMDHLPKMSQTSGGPLSAAISSVGMACLSNVTNSSDVMFAARQEYASAVRLTNMALQDPVQTKSDGMLTTVMLLGMFEVSFSLRTLSRYLMLTSGKTITCRAPQSMKAWTSHVEGAAELLRLRGLEQFQHRIGLNMFFQLRAQIVKLDFPNILFDQFANTAYSLSVPSNEKSIFQLLYSNGQSIWKIYKLRMKLTQVD